MSNLRALIIVLLGRLEIPPYLTLQLRLVPLQRQHVIPTAFFDLLRYRSLAPHRIQRHDTPLQFKLLQQLRHRHNLVRLLIRFHLSKHHPIATCPGTDHMQRLHPSLAIMRSPMGLAVQRDDLPVTELDHVLHPTEEAVLEAADRQRRNDPRNGVIDRDPIGQRNIPAKPIQFRATELLDVAPSFGTTEHRAHAQHDDIDQLMLLVPVDSRVLQLREMFDQTLGGGDVHCRSRSSPWPVWH